MAGRPKIFDEEEAVQQATALFWQQGYEATSLQDLLQVMGIQKGSFYHAFSSKKALFLRCMQAHDTHSFSEFMVMLAGTDDPIGLIKGLFLQFATDTTANHGKGCFAGNIVAELSGTDAPLAAGAKAYLLTLERIFFEQITWAQLNGQLQNPTDAKVLARYLLNLWNGINITRRLYPKETELRPVLEFQLSILT